ncbi:hypothetical protein [Rickettsia endosymbiont of Orchestes rusci]
MANNLPYYGYYKYGVIPWPLPRYPVRLFNFFWIRWEGPRYDKF